MINNKAFTITEVLLVVVILGIIAGFAVPEYKKSILRAHERNAISQLKIVQGANLMYRATHSNKFLAGDYWDIDSINEKLGINLISQGSVIYEYHSLDPYQEFDINAYFNDPSGSGKMFEICVNQEPLSNQNPCCEYGDCPTLPPCTFVCH